MRRLLADLSSVCWTALLAGKDTEGGKQVEHEGKTVLVNGADYGYENAINMFVSVWEKKKIQPRDTIVVFESGQTKLFRKQWLPGYKDSRDSRPPEAYEEFNKLKEMLIDAVKSLGGIAVTRQGLEGDDVLAFLAERLVGEKVILSNDGDLARLITKDVSLWKAGKELTENPYGPFPAELITTYKATVGDSGDSIPGAKGFGPKAFMDALVNYGDDGIAEIEQLIKDKNLGALAEVQPFLKPLQKLIDQADSVYASFSAAKLYPEQVESVRVPLEWFPGFCQQREAITDTRLQKYGGVTRLVHAANYQAAYDWAKIKIAGSPFVALDIETSTPEESDDWLRANKKDGSKDDDVGVDVRGSELCGLSLTFGDNSQYTVYLTADHVPTEAVVNLPVDLVRKFVELVPAGTPIAIQNVAFELPILYLTWGDAWKANGFHGFVPNAHDTKILANYVDENSPSGLKKLTKRWFGYDQTTYAEVTGGRKMSQMSAQEVLAYGADDTIMTAALYSFFKVVLEVEQSWDAFLKVEVRPAYLTALAYVQGVPLSLERMAELERQDDERVKPALALLHTFLIDNGWEGTVCPVYADTDLDEGKGIKAIYFAVLGRELKTQVRTPSKIIKLIEDEDDIDAKLLARYLADRNLAQLNDWVASRFDGTPEIDLSSPKQMGNLLYTVMDLPVRIVNTLTPTEREKKPDLAKAVWGFKKLQQGSKSQVALTPEQLLLLKQKASTDDASVDFALAFDGPSKPEIVPVLKAIKVLKTVGTRRSLFYKPYRNIKHWKTRRVHSSINQCATVTRRYSASAPNVTQLPKDGDGLEFREVYVPHKRGAVVVSIDFGSQEIRGQADLSRDEGLLSLFGDDPKNFHALTGSKALARVWSNGEIGELALRFEADLKAPEGRYNLLMSILSCDEPALKKKGSDLRKGAKITNFASAYGITAQGLSEKLISTYQEADEFLKAKYASFPGYEEWKEVVEAEAKRKGYLTTYLGGRRHLQAGLMGERWMVEKTARQGSNFKIQGSSAEQTKLAMGDFWDTGAVFDYDAQFYFPVHDELVASVTYDDAVPFIRAMHSSMVKPYWNTVAVVASISLGPNYGIQIEVGDDFDEDAIRAAIDTLRQREAVAA